MNKIVLVLAIASSFLVGFLAARNRPLPTTEDTRTAAEAESTARREKAEPVETKPPEKADPPEKAKPQARSAEGGEATRTQRVYSTVQQVERLRALPYADATFDPDGEKRGVIVHDEARAFDGLNFYSSRDLPAAFLVDMKGRFVYQWRTKSGPWQHVDLLPSGHVVALVKDTALIKVDPNSKVLWTFKALVHHDHWRTGDGRIFVLSRKSEPLPEIHPRHKVLADYILVLSPDGELIEEISVVDLVLNSPFAFLLPSLRYRDWSQDGERPEDVDLDILHTNHVEVFEDPHGSHPFTRGNVLISFRHIDTIAVADLEKKAVVWAWGPSNLVRQHHPVRLANGNLLIFNNGLQKSQVLELDPRSLEVVWTYSDGTDFFTSSRGSNQRLPNGNTLITESDTGYVFEVTPAGEKVWEFANPQINKKSERSAIWRMVRFERDDLPFLDN